MQFFLILASDPDEMLMPGGSNIPRSGFEGFFYRGGIIEQKEFFVHNFAKIRTGNAR